MGIIKVGRDQNVHEWGVASAFFLQIVWKVQSEITIVNKAELPQMFKLVMFRKESESIEILGKDVATKSNLHQKRLIQLV